MAVNDKTEFKGPDVPIKETERSDEKQMEVCSQNDASESKDPDLPIEETDESKKEEMELSSQDAALEKGAGDAAEQQHLGACARQGQHRAVRARQA